MDKWISSSESYSKVFVKHAHICMPVNIRVFLPSASKKTFIPETALFVQTEKFTYKHRISGMGTYQVSEVNIWELLNI